MTWQFAPLRELIAAPLANGRSVPSRGGGFPVLRLTALSNGGIDLHERKEGAWTRDEAERFLVHGGDFLVSRGNGSLDLVGRGGLVGIDPEPVAFPDTMIRVRPNHQRLEPRYLALAWSSPVVRAQIEGAARTTAGIYKINQAHLASVTIPVPPLREQRRIADLLEDHLSRLDAAADGLATARQRLRALERSALEVHFGGDRSILLGDLVADISAGKSFGASNAPARDDQWGIIKVSAMTWGEFKPEENKAVPDDRIDRRFEIHEGDLLVSRANTADYVGASVLVGQVRPKLLLSDKSLRITPKEGVRAEWLWRALQAPTARRQISALATGTKDSMRNISQTALHQVLLPKTDETGQSRSLAEFAVIAEATSRLSAEVADSEARLGHLRASLLAAAFSGRLTGNVGGPSAVEEMIDA